jgi:hypothetical protein
MIKILFLLILIFSRNVFAVDIANCSNPSGYAYYPELGMIDKKMSGWNKDKISNGITKVTRNDKGEYDIVFVDATKNIISSREDGGGVFLLNQGKSSFSILVVYQGKTAEIYSFLKNNSGKLEYLHITSRAGDLIPIAKSSLMQGECSFIDFSKIY